MNTTRSLPPLPLQRDPAERPWIERSRPATLGLLATVAVALISAASLLQPQAAEAETANAIVSAVRGA